MTVPLLELHPLVDTGRSLGLSWVCRYVEYYTSVDGIPFPRFFPMMRVYPGHLVVSFGHCLMISVGKVCNRPRRVSCSGRSLINIRNRTGPRTDPCGTPLTTGTFSEDCPSTKTCCVLEFRKDEIH